MNGRKHRLMKLLALTTVLAGGGVGVYQAIHHGLHLGANNKLSGAFDSGATQLRIDDEPSAGSSTLDAVADALASQSRPTTTQHLPAALDETLVQPTATETPELPAVVELPASPMSAVGDRYAQALPAETDTPRDVARGQEPADDQFEMSEATLEEQAVDAAEQDASLRARAAFSDRPPTAPQSRYGFSQAMDGTQRNSDISGERATDSTPPATLKHADEDTLDPFARPEPAEMASTATAGQALGLESEEPVRTRPESGIQPLPGGSHRATEQSAPVAGEEEAYGYQAMTAEPEPAGRDSFYEAAPNPLRSRNEWPAAQPQESSSTRGEYPVADELAAEEGTGRPGERALEGPQQPALVIEKLAPAEIQVGKPAKFMVTVRNASGQPANSVVVHDEVPQGTRLISTTPRAQELEGKLVWQLGTLSVGETRSVEMLLMPIAEGEVGSVATVTSSTQASVKTRCTMPQLALRLTAPQQVMIGSEQRVRIELHNPGTGDATGVMLYETVPEELRHSSGQALEFEVGTLRSGETRELELVLTAEKRGKVVNRISARADGNLQVEQEIEFDVIGPELEVALQGPTVRYLERPATYTVSVENPGTAPAREIELVTRLPKGMQFVSANNLGEYDQETHAVYWSLAELPEGEAGEVELVAMPVESGEQEIKVEGRALQGLEDQTFQHVRVEGIAAIMFEVRDLEDPIEVGGETSYEIRVVNQGTKAATGVRVRATLEPGMSVLSASGETRHATQAGAVIFEPLSSLAPKTDTVYRIHVKGVQSGDQRIAVEVSTDDIGDPIRKEESTRVFGDQ